MSNIKRSSQRSSKKNINNIGILDPNGKKSNPITGQNYQNLYKNELDPTSGSPITYKFLGTKWSSLPMYSQAREVIRSIQNNQIVLLRSKTGSGKTVLTPKFAAHALGYKGKIVITIPKKVTAKGAAEFAAKTLDVTIGEEVGYYFKGKRLVNTGNKQTLLTYTTTGSLLSRITGNDPDLSDYDAIIVDEAHERSIQMDMQFMLLRHIAKRRPDLKIVIMSATIDLQKFLNYFGSVGNGFAQLDIEGETPKPIVDHYLPREPKDWKIDTIELIIKILQESDEGDILVFVKSGAEGRTLCQKLSEASRAIGLYPFCTELEGKSQFDMVNEERQITKDRYAINVALYHDHPNRNNNHPFERKVVMSTNVAESSLTVDGIVYVIDSGMEYMEQYFPNENARSLMEEYIAQSAVTQRRGRAGRTRPGVCYHMYTEKQFKGFVEYPVPDIQKTDLSSYLLDLLRMKGIETVGNLRGLLNEMMDPPEKKFIDSGLNILLRLDAINGLEDSSVLTSLGKSMSHFRALKPTLARTILISYFYHCSNEVCNIISMIILADGQMEMIFRKPRKDDEIRIAAKKHRNFYHQSGDHLSMLRLYNKYMEKADKMNKSELKRWCIENYVSFKVLDKTNELSRKLKSTLMQIMKSNRRSHQLNIDLNMNQNNVVEFLGKGGDATRNSVVLNYEEVKKFKNKIQKTNSHDNDILLSFIIGSFIQIGAGISRGQYRTCFAIESVDTRIANTSILTQYKSDSKYILYDELFRFGNSYKLNICSKVSETLANIIDKQYLDILKKCSAKKKQIDDKKHGKKGKKGYDKKKYGKKKYGKRKYGKKYKK